MNVRGLDLLLHPEGDYVSDVIRRTGDFFEAAILDELRDRISGGVIVDAGAMIGNHAAYFAAFLPHTAIWAFEPVPANLALLRVNMRRYGRVRVQGVALSDRAGMVRMDYEPDNYGHARVSAEGMLEVEALTLDSYGLRDVSLLKIDVERHEPEVLAGARETIERCRPLILIEDWDQAYGSLLPGYRVAVEWQEAHQTVLYAPVAVAV